MKYASLADEGALHHIRGLDSKEMEEWFGGVVG
jgi:hypothetical protein